MILRLQFGMPKMVFRDRKTLFGIPNCRRKIITQLEFAEFLLQLRPCVYCSRNADRQHACGWNCVAMQFRQFGFHLIVTQAEWRTAAAVDAVEFVFLRAINNCEKVAANSVRDWFHQTKRRVCRDRRVHGAAAAFQNFDAELRRRGNAGANYSVPCQNFRSSGKILSGNPIDLRVEWKSTE